MRIILGQSVGGRDVVAHVNFDPDAMPMRQPADSEGASTLLIGGTHGDERATVPLLEKFIQDWMQAGHVQSPLAVIPLLNPDGYAKDSRYNARGVDLNRNFPHRWSPETEEPSGPAPLSEPESRLLQEFILKWQPDKIVSLHWALAEIDADGPQSAALGRHLWATLPPHPEHPYRLRVHGEGLITDDGCAGSLGQWAGHGLVYPDQRRPAMITLELPYHPAASPRPAHLPEDHWETVRSMWGRNPQRYLAGVEAHVHRMLEAACRFPRMAAQDGSGPS